MNTRFRKNRLANFHKGRDVSAAPHKHLPPLLLPVVAFLAGQAFYNLYPLYWPPFLLAGLALLALCLFMAGKKGRFNLPLLCLAMFCFSSGWLGMYRAAPVPENHISVLNRHCYQITRLEITEPAQPNQYGWQAQTRVLEIAGRPAQGGLELRGDNKTPAPRVGQVIEANLRLRPIVNFANPGSPDWIRIRALDGIHASAYVGVNAGLTVFADNTPAMGLVRMRQGWSDAINTMEAGEPRGLIRALTLGQRAEISSTLSNNFSLLGIAHIISISGMHLAMVWGFAYGALRLFLSLFPWLLLRFNVPRLAASLAFAPVFAYALLGGASLPTLRALIMTFCLVACLWINRPYRAMGGLCLAAFIMCLLWPESLFTISFQLSFSAVCAIVLVSMPLVNYLKYKANFPRPLAYLAAFLAFNTAIELFIWPLTVYSFHQVPWLSIVANAVFIPLIGFIILPLSLMAGFLSFVWSGGGDFLFHLALYFSRLAIDLVNDLASLPFAVSYIAGPGIASIVFIYAAWLAGLIAINKKGLMVSALCLLTAIVLWGWPMQKNLADGRMEAWILDVGQGQAVVAKMPEGRLMVIDCGISGNMDPGQRVVAPFLWQQGFGRVDILVASHPHPDHYSGLAFLLRWFNPEELWINGEEGGNDENSQEYQNLLALARARNVAVKTPRAPFSADFGAGHIEVLWPLTDFMFKGSNDRSLMLGIGQDDNWLWLPGDNGPKVEKLMRGFPPGRHLLLAAHHGGKGSCSEELLAALQPQAVLFSTGCMNTYGMPRAETLARVNEAGASIYSTGNNGALHLINMPDGWRIIPYLATPRPCTWNFAD